MAAGLPYELTKTASPRKLVGAGLPREHRHSRCHPPQHYKASQRPCSPPFKSLSADKH